MKENTSEAAYDSASQLEQGRGSVAAGEIDANYDDKPSLPSPNTVNTVGSSTLRTAGTWQSSISKISKAKTWAAEAGQAVLPRRSGERAKVIIRQLEDYPLGYPKMGVYLESDDSFNMYRRFGLLHSRLLLHKQDQLRCMEDRLLALDKLDERDEGGRALLQCREDDDEREPESAPGGQTRRELLAAIQRTLLEYGRILLQSQQLGAMNRPSDRDHASVVNFVENEQPLMEGDRDFVYHKEDLVTVRAGRENAWLDAAIEAILRWYPCRPIKYLFCSDETRRKTDNPNIHYFTRSRINFFVTLIIVLIILVLLVLPSWALYYMTTDRRASESACIGVLLVSTLLFSSVLSLFTKAKRHEILAAAAGYCAVLVVFVGNVGSGFGGP